MAVVLGEDMQLSSLHLSYKTGTGTKRPNHPEERFAPCMTVAQASLRVFEGEVSATIPAMKLMLVVRQLEGERTRISERLAKVTEAIAALKGGSPLSKRRKLSAAAIARIRAAQRARWAKWRKSRKAD